jgi:hypothetical protein
MFSIHANQEGKTTFLHIGNTYFNVSQIKTVKPFSKPNDPAHWAAIELVDGVRFEGLVLPDRLEALERQIFPAPPGYEHISVEFEDGEVKTWKETVVAFAYEPGGTELLPLTLECGLRESFAVKTPQGTIHCPDTTYPSYENFIDEMIAMEKARLA